MDIFWNHTLHFLYSFFFQSLYLYTSTTLVCIFFSIEINIYLKKIKIKPDADNLRSHVQTNLMNY